MEKARHILKTVLLLLAAAGAGMGLTLFVINALGPSPDGLTRLGRGVLKAGGEGWEMAATEHFTGYAPSGELVELLLRKAEHASREVEAALELPPLTNRAHCFLITDSNLWKTVRQRGGWRTDGRALQYGSEFVLYIPEENAEMEDAIPHEIVHFRLRQVYENRQPLALEEGLANYLGWEITLKWHLRNDTIITRTKPRLPVESLWSLKDLAGATAYHQDPARNLAFYRQSEEWVRSIVSMIGPASLGEFVRLVFGGDMTWEQALRGRWMLSDQQMDKLAVWAESGK
ncbi:MAG: hypothetical protein AB7T27_01220 [Kiritimatiellia bacterium]